MDQQELQRIAQLVEMNRQKMARIEEQMTRLSEIRMETTRVSTLWFCQNNPR